MNYAFYSKRTITLLALTAFVAAQANFLQAHEPLKSTSDSKKESLSWSTAAVGIYTAKKTGQALKKTTRNQALRWIVKNPARAGALITTLLISTKRPLSFRKCLGVITRITGTTLRVSAKASYGLSFAQDKMGQCLQWSGKKILQPSATSLRQGEVTIPFRLSDSTIEKIILKTPTPPITQRPSSAWKRLFS